MPTILQKTIDLKARSASDHLFGWLGKHNTNIMGIKREREREKERERRVTLCVASVSVSAKYYIIGLWSVSDHASLKSTVNAAPVSNDWNHRTGRKSGVPPFPFPPPVIYATMSPYALHRPCRRYEMLSADILKSERKSKWEEGAEGVEKGSRQDHNSISSSSWQFLLPYFSNSLSLLFPLSRARNLFLVITVIKI